MTTIEVGDLIETRMLGLKGLESQLGIVLEVAIHMNGSSSIWILTDSRVTYMVYTRVEQVERFVRVHNRPKGK